MGSLDVEYAQEVIKGVKTAPESKYLLILYHPIPEEDLSEIEAVLKSFPNYEFKIIGSNNDYQKKFGTDRYSPEEFLKLMNEASCVIGNSSSSLKEASIMGIPVVNVGSRQQNRLTPENVINCKCIKEDIYNAISYQLRHGRYEPSCLYFKPETSKRIAEIISKLLN